MVVQLRKPTLAAFLQKHAGLTPAVGLLQDAKGKTMCIENKILIKMRNHG